MPDAVEALEKTVVNKTYQNSYPHESYSLVVINNKENFCIAYRIIIKDRDKSKAGKENRE